MMLCLMRLVFFNIFKCLEIVGWLILNGFVIFFMEVLLWVNLDKIVWCVGLVNVVNIVLRFGDFFI